MKRIALLSLLPIFFMGCSPKTKNNTAETPQNNSLETYTMPHLLHHRAYDSLQFTTEQQWDSLHNKIPQPKTQVNYTLHTSYKTFGWHLYSKGSAYKNYNFSLLWGIAYFSYQVHPKTGSYTSIHQWKTTALMDSAKAKNCKVFLSVSNFGSENNSVFLANPKAQETLIDSLKTLLKFRDADGVHIDFEGIPPKSKEAFNRFMIALATALRNANPKYMTALSVYAVDYHKVFDIPLLYPHIDFYTLMAYDYYGGFSSVAGPISPLKSSSLWGEYSVASSVDYYLKAGITPDKLIVGLPYYGAEWKTQSKGIPAKVAAFKTHHTYSFIENFVDSLRIEVKYNPESFSSYSLFEDKKGKPMQIWFEDSLSLSHKYNWVKDKKLAGIGIWALDYDDGYTALWDVMAATFGTKQ